MDSRPFALISGSKFTEEDLSIVENLRLTIGCIVLGGLDAVDDIDKRSNRQTRCDHLLIFCDPFFAAL